jgi:WD40 repeat protein
VDNSTIRVIKLSEDGKFLSIGLKNGKIKLYEIIGFDYNKFLLSYNKENIMEYLNFVKEKAYKSLEGHKEDVIDLSWSPFYYYLLLSSSVDGYVILWNVNLEEQKAKIECFNHEKIVTSVSFSPTEKSIFITGCLDKIIRIWDISSLLDENDSKNINQKKLT